MLRILQQIEFNRNTNLFCELPASAFQFLPATADFLNEQAATLHQLDEATENQLIEFTTNRVLESLYQVNQYYHFTNADIHQLKQIYKVLFTHIQSIVGNATPELIAYLQQKHYLNLNHWLQTSNAFASEIYTTQAPFINKPVVCELYQPQTQIEIFGIDSQNLAAPILDVGCGKEGLLVRHLRAQGYEAIGIDREVPDEKYFIQVDWLNFHFEKNTWGTIISHMSFSNHFNHHHLRTDGNYIVYAKKYMEILQSLKAGGTFYYTPGLSFIETYLPADLYALSRKNVAALPYEAVAIQKVK